MAGVTPGGVPVTAVPEDGPPAADADQVLLRLDRATCVALLRTAAFGRLVFTTRALPDVIPVNFRLLDDRLLMELDGPSSPVAQMEQELSRAIIDATVDECAFGDQHTRLVKYLAVAE